MSGQIARMAAARILLNDKFFDDKRFGLLAAFCAEDEDKTRMRVLELWRYCFKHRVDSMTKEDVDVYSRWTGSTPFAELMVRSKLAERNEDETFRVKGVKERATKKEPLADDHGKAVARFIANYCMAFKERWKSSPDIMGSDRGIARNIVKELGEQRAIQLVQTYLTMSDQFYLRARHSLGVFMTNLKPIGVKCDTGRMLSTADIQGMEQRESLSQQTYETPDWVRD